MSKSVAQFEFIPGESEQIEANIIIPKETRSIIQGVVKDHKNEVIKDAVVKLFEAGQGDDTWLKHIAYTTTDEDGIFLFGPLCSKKQYVIRVIVNNIKIKEVVITPDEECNLKNEWVKDKEGINTCSREEFYSKDFYHNKYNDVYYDKHDEDYDDYN